jgi:SAM-dependent MidA family methyltransferase
VQPWDVAWQAALYGPRGFYRRAVAAQHFRTSVSASPLFAEAIARLARECGLGAVVDVGSGRGELLQLIADVDPGLGLVGVDVVPRPPDLPRSARWLESPGGSPLPALVCSDALVVANEWLDDVPCPVLEVDDAGVLRVVEVATDGTERLGGAATAEQLGWVQRWWPAAEPGSRVEVGLPRDRAWAALVAQAPGCVLVAIDYSHLHGARPAAGTLMGYRAGTSVAPVPDGTCDITAHVALDAVAAAAGLVTASLLTSQRQALLALGVSGSLPPHSSAARDPAGYLAGLARAASAAELLEPGGLGGFGWLVQSRGPALPAALAAKSQAVTGKVW